MVLDNSLITSQLQQHFPHDRTYCPETQTWVKVYPIPPSTTLSEVCRTFLARYQSTLQSTNFDRLKALIDTELTHLDDNEVDETTLVAILSGAIFKVQFTKLREHGIRENHAAKNENGHLGQFVLKCSLQDITDGQTEIYGLAELLFNRAQGLKFYSNLSSLNNDAVVADLKLLSFVLRICVSRSSNDDDLQGKIAYLSKNLFSDLSTFSKDDKLIYSRLVPDGDLAQRYKYAHICTLINDGTFEDDLVDVAARTCYSLDLLRLEQYNGKTYRSPTEFQKIDFRTVVTVRDNLIGGGTELSVAYMLADALNAVRQSVVAYNLLQKYRCKENLLLLDDHSFRIRLNVYLDAGKIDEALKLCQGKDPSAISEDQQMKIVSLLVGNPSLIIPYGSFGSRILLESESTPKSRKLAYLLACTDPVTVAMYIGVEDQNSFLDCARECVRETFERCNTLAIDEQQEEELLPASPAVNQQLAIEAPKTDSKKRSFVENIDKLPENIWPEEPSLKKVRVDRNKPLVDVEMQGESEEYHTPKADTHPMVTFDGNDHNASHQMGADANGDSDDEIEIIETDSDGSNVDEVRESLSTKSYHSDMDQEESGVHALSVILEGLLDGVSGCSVGIDDENNRVVIHCADYDIVNEVQYIVEEECDCGVDDVIILGPDDHGLEEVGGVKCSDEEPDFDKKNDMLEEHEELGEEDAGVVEILDDSSSEGERSSDDDEQAEDDQKSVSEQEECINSETTRQESIDDSDNSINSAPSVESDASSNSAQLKANYDAASDGSQLTDQIDTAKAPESEESLEHEGQEEDDESNSVGSIKISPEESSEERDEGDLDDMDPSEELHEAFNLIRSLLRKISGCEPILDDERITILCASNTIKTFVERALMENGCADNEIIIVLGPDLHGLKEVAGIKCSGDDKHGISEEAEAGMQSDDEEEDDVVEILKDNNSGQSEGSDEQQVPTDDASSEMDAEPEDKDDVLHGDELSMNEKTKNIDSSTVLERDSPAKYLSKEAKDNIDRGFTEPELGSSPSGTGELGENKPMDQGPGEKEESNVDTNTEVKVADGLVNDAVDDGSARSDDDAPYREEAEKNDESLVDADISAVEAALEMENDTMEIDSAEPSDDASRHDEAEDKVDSNVDVGENDTMDVDLAEPGEDILPREIAKGESGVDASLQETEPEVEQEVDVNASEEKTTVNTENDNVDIGLAKLGEDVSRQEETEEKEYLEVDVQASAVETPSDLKNDAMDVDAYKLDEDASRHQVGEEKVDPEDDVDVPAPNITTDAILARSDEDVSRQEEAKETEDMETKGVTRVDTSIVETPTDNTKSSVAEESKETICKDSVDRVAKISPRKSPGVVLLSSSDEDDAEENIANEALSARIVVKDTPIQHQQQNQEVEARSLVDPTPSDTLASLEGIVADRILSIEENLAKEKRDDIVKSSDQPCEDVTNVLPVGTKDEKLEQLGDKNGIMGNKESSSPSETCDIETKVVADVSSGKQDAEVESGGDEIDRDVDKRNEIIAEVVGTDERAEIELDEDGVDASAEEQNESSAKVVATDGIGDGNLEAKLDDSASRPPTEEMCNSIEADVRKDNDDKNQMELKSGKDKSVADSGEGRETSDLEEGADREDLESDEYNDDDSLSSRSSMGSSVQRSRRSPRLAAMPRRAKRASLEKMLEQLPPVKEDEVANIDGTIENSVSKPATRRSNRKTSGRASMSSAMEEESSRSQSLRRSTRKRTPASSVASDEVASEVPARKTRKRADSVSSTASTKSVGSRTSARIRNRQKKTEENEPLSPGQSSAVSTLTDGRRTRRSKAKATVDDQTISSEMTPASVARSTRSSTRKAASTQATPVSSVASAGERSRTRATRGRKKAEEPAAQSPPRRSRRLAKRS